jgi:ankyrin repeat protein
LRYTNDPPLYLAVRAGSLRDVKNLLDDGADVNAIIDHRGGRALHWAAAEGSVSMCELLLDRGANPNQRDHALRWPLYDAAAHGVTDNIEALIRRGGRTDMVGPSGVTLLHAAAIGGFIKAIAYLRGLGLSPDQVDFGGNLPLHLAAWEFHAEALAGLLPSDRNVARPDGQGASALHTLGQRLGQIKEFDELVRAVPRAVATAAALIELGHPLEIRDRKGRTPLFDAALGHPDLVRLLIDRGADIHAVDPYGGSALLELARSARPTGDEEIESLGRTVSALVGAGADLAQADDQGNTPARFLLGRRNLVELRPLAKASMARDAARRALQDEIRPLDGPE